MKLLNKAIRDRINIVETNGWDIGNYTRQLIDKLETDFSGVWVLEFDTKGRITITYDSAQQMPQSVGEFSKDCTYFRPIKSKFHKEIKSCNVASNSFSSMSREFFRECAKDPVVFNELIIAIRRGA